MKILAAQKAEAERLEKKRRQKEEETSINNPGGAASPGGWLVGGATAFTKLLPSGEPLRVLPRAGNAIYWSNNYSILLGVSVPSNTCAIKSNEFLSG